jgi:hypothetical protein
VRAGKPPEGWGEDPDKIEALIKDDPQALRMFRREVVAEPHKHKADSDNITIKTPTSDDKGKRAKQDNSDNVTIKDQPPREKESRISSGG